MKEVLKCYYQTYFSDDKTMLKKFYLVDAYLKRYNLRIDNYKIGEKNNKIFLSFIVENGDGRYSSIYGIAELSKDEIYIEVDKELFNGDCCIYEHINVTKDGFRGNMCDFAFFNAEVASFKNGQKQEYFGEICETCFNQDGIEDNDNCYIPYDTDEYNSMMDEILEIHSLSKEEIAEKYDFDGYTVKSLIVHDEDDIGINNYINFDKSLYLGYKIRRGRRK